MGGTLIFDPVNPNTVLTTVDNNGSSENVATSTDGGTTWAAVPSNVVADVYTPTFSLDSLMNPPVIYALESGNLAVRSTDFGNSWTALGISEMPSADPEFADSAFTATSWSPDGGITWTPVFTNNFRVSPSTPPETVVATSGSPQYLFLPSQTRGLLRINLGP